jgi:hypothetical protein
MLLNCKIIGFKANNRDNPKTCIDCVPVLFLTFELPVPGTFFLDK